MRNAAPVGQARTQAGSPPISLTLVQASHLTGCSEPPIFGCVSVASFTPGRVSEPNSSQRQKLDLCVEGGSTIWIAPYGQASAHAPQWMQPASSMTILPDGARVITRGGQS